MVLFGWLSRVKRDKDEAAKVVDSNEGKGGDIEDINKNLIDPE